MALSIQPNSMSEGNIIHFPNIGGKNEKETKIAKLDLIKSENNPAVFRELSEGLDLINETKKEILRTIELGFKLQDQNRTLQMVEELLKNF